ncbi:MAG: hypothetical protein WCS52_09890 [bacterium]
MHLKFLKAGFSVHVASALFITGVMAVVSVPRVGAQSVMDEIAVMRESLKLDRTAVVAEAMQLTEAEGTAFWPLYREYRAAMDGTHDGLVKLVLEYADTYPIVPQKKAEQMFKDYVALEREYTDTKVKYLKKLAKTIPAAKALRLAQIENRLDLVMRVQLAGILPLVPAKEKISGQ